MKIAICITGQARYHWQQIWTECNFLNINNSDLQVDFFVHTWTTEYEDAGQVDNNYLIPINDLDKLVKDIKQIFNPIRLVVDDYSVSRNELLGPNMEPQLYSFFQTLEMIHESEIEYDFILKARFDIFILPGDPEGIYIGKVENKDKQLYEKTFYECLKYFYSMPDKNILHIEGGFLDSPFRMHVSDKIFLIKGNWIFNSLKYNFFELWETEIYPMDEFPLIEKPDINSAHVVWPQFFEVLSNYADIKICITSRLQSFIIRKGRYDPTHSFKQLAKYPQFPVKKTNNKYDKNCS